MPVADIETTLVEFANISDLLADRFLVRSIVQLIEMVLSNSEFSDEDDRARLVNASLAVTWDGIDAADLIRIRHLPEAMFNSGGTLPLELAALALRREDYKSVPLVRLDALKLAVALSA